VKKNQIRHLQEEVSYLRIEEQLKNPSFQQKTLDLEQVIKKKICSDLPNAFWERKKHIISLPYEKDFNERMIPPKARPTQMNSDLLEHCKKEFKLYLTKKLVRPLKSPWSCAAFYVNNAAEKERGVPRLIINYKSLNNVLQWIRYPIPNKRDLLNGLYEAKVFSKFDMKIWILANTNYRSRPLQNRIYSAFWILGVERNAFWPKKCPIKISKYHE